MPHETNPMGQPVGMRVFDWKPPPLPGRELMSGQYCRLDPLNPDRHALELFQANSLDADDRSWTYLPYGPFKNIEEYTAWLVPSASGNDPLFFAIIDSTTGKAVGLGSYLRIDPRHGSIEVGHLNFSPLLQRSRAATEAMYLLMKHAFELGYRRYEWKCNALNLPSRQAAQRLGFSFEGIFRQASIYKDRNRDTAWFAIIDSEWPALKVAFDRWLDRDNFDADGQQKVSLSSLTSGLLYQRDCI